VNEHGVDFARKLIDSRQYVLDTEWGEVQPSADDQNGHLERHECAEYADWHLGLTDGAQDGTKCSGSVCDLVELPRLRDTFEDVGAAIIEADARAGGQVLDGA
jgi:hypothetical protein